MITLLDKDSELNMNKNQLKIKNKVSGIPIIS